LNIPDVKGRESLFEAEMYRAKNHINLVQQLKENEYSFVIMDEIFNSTNYEEGVAGAYIIAKELGKIDNSITMITTHFGYLTKLEKASNYINYMFSVDKEDDKIIRTYKINKGISKQYLALDLLQNNGFNTEMIHEAREIFQELVNKNKEPEETKTEETKEIKTEETKEIKTEETEETKTEEEVKNKKDELIEKEDIKETKE
jgi:DNA mismatch repair ATPase MutS